MANMFTQPNYNNILYSYCSTLFEKDEIDRIANAPAGQIILVNNPTEFREIPYIPNMPKKPIEDVSEGNKLTPLERRRLSEGRPLDDWRHD